MHNMNINTIRSNISNFYKKKKEESREANNRYSNKWYKYYHDNRWHRLREWKYLNNPVCEVCEKQGRMTQTDDIHHLHVFGSGATEQEKWNLLLDPFNLCACCARHHAMFHELLRASHQTYVSVDDVVKYEEKIMEFN